MCATDSFRVSDRAHWTSTRRKAGLVMLRRSIRDYACLYHMVGRACLLGGSWKASGAVPVGCSSLAATAAATILLARLGGMLGRKLLRVYSVGGPHAYN